MNIKTEAFEVRDTITWGESGGGSNYKGAMLTGDEVQALKNLFSDDSHSAHHLRVEVMHNIIPQVFKTFEKGKYYRSKYSQMIFKCTGKHNKNYYLGYGINGKCFEVGSVGWASDEDFLNFEEVTQHEFLEVVKNYAQYELGFVKGAKFRNNNIYMTAETKIHTISGKIEEGSMLDGEDHLQVKSGGIYKGFSETIFLDGEFAEIIGQEKEVFTPTAELRYIKLNHKHPLTSEKKVIKVLQQKWQGEHDFEWREIETK